MVHEKTTTLIETLHAQTMAGEIPWAEGEGRNAGAFEAKGYQVHIEATASTMNFVLMDRDGRELENLNEEDLSESAAPSGKNLETLVREIHNRGRRAALGTDQAIDQLLGAIGG